jgi:hypothetical protein
MPATRRRCTIAEAIAMHGPAAAEAACIHHIEALAELALLVLAKRASGAVMDRRVRRHLLEEGMSK